MLRACLKFALLVSATTLWLLAFRGTLPADDSLADKLDRKIDIDKAIDAPLKDVLKFLADRFNVKFSIDKENFMKEGRKGDLEQIRVTLPKMPGASLALTCRILLPSVDAVYEVRNNQVVIVPDTKDRKPRPFPPPTENQKESVKRVREHVAKSAVELKEPGIEAPLKDVLEFLTDRYDLTILLDSAAFRKAQLDGAVIAKTKIRLVSQIAPLEKVLDQICEPFQIKWEIEDKIILLRPAPNK
jgi:hypothetical protein